MNLVNTSPVPAAQEQERANNFNLLRLVLATLVVLGHFKGLGGGPYVGIYSYADFAVHAFFIVSGYLIAWSYYKDRDLINFYIRRLFRIYPLYFTVVIAQAIAMLVMLGNWSAHIAGTLKYLAVNLVFANFLSYDIDGVLAGQHDPGINGSLWTLKIEVAFYIILPLMCLLFKRYKLASLALIYIASTLFFLYFHSIGKVELAKQLPGQLRFFVVGIGLYLYNSKIVFTKYWAFGAAIVLFILCTLFRSDMYFNLIYPFVIGFLVFICAMRLPALPVKFDISYGVYLLHAPIIQILIFLGLYQDNLLFLGGLILGVFTLAFLAEHMIEKPGIRLGKYLTRLRRNKAA